MVSYMYVDEKPYEIVEVPKAGQQYKLWYNKKTRSNPMGQEFREVINGQEVHVRAFSKEKLEAFRVQVFTRVLPLKVVIES